MLTWVQVEWMHVCTKSTLDKCAFVVEPKFKTFAWFLSASLLLGVVYVCKREKEGYTKKESDRSWGDGRGAGQS